MTEAFPPYLTLPDNGSARHSRTTTGRPYANAALLRVETGSDQRLRYVASAVPYSPLKRSIKGNPRSIVGYGIYDVPQNDGRSCYRERKTGMKGSAKRYVASAVPYSPLNRSIKGNPRSIVGYGIYDVPQNDGRCVYRTLLRMETESCQRSRYVASAVPYSPLNRSKKTALS